MRPAASTLPGARADTARMPVKAEGHDLSHASSDEEHGVCTTSTYRHRVGAFLGILAMLAVPLSPLCALDIINLNLLNGLTCTLAGPGDGHQTGPPRHRYAYIPFGGGRRACIGASFAELETLLVLAAVARRYRLELTVRGIPVPSANITLRPGRRLPMRLIRRS